MGSLKALKLNLVTLDSFVFCSGEESGTGKCCLFKWGSKYEKNYIHRHTLRRTFSIHKSIIMLNGLVHIFILQLYRKSLAGQMLSKVYTSVNYPNNMHTSESLCLQSIEPIFFWECTLYCWYTLLIFIFFLGRGSNIFCVYQLQFTKFSHEILKLRPPLWVLICFTYIVRFPLADRNWLLWIKEKYISPKS